MGKTSLTRSVSVWGWAESDALLVLEVDLEASFVDDDLMVEPTEDDELVLVGLSAFRPGSQVVDL